MWHRFVHWILLDLLLVLEKCIQIISFNWIGYRKAFNPKNLFDAFESDYPQ